MRSSAHACSSPENGSSKARSEEHTSELQSRSDLVCRLLLEKKKKKQGHQKGAEDHTHQPEGPYQGIHSIQPDRAEADSEIAHPRDRQTRTHPREPQHVQLHD